jgi:hypothetical protein
MSGKQYGNMMLTLWKHRENVKTKYEKLFRNMESSTLEDYTT